jgi:hypothetical protein
VMDIVFISLKKTQLKKLSWKNELTATKLIRTTKHPEASMKEEKKKNFMK